MLERGDSTLAALLQRAEHIVDLVKPSVASEAKRRCGTRWATACFAGVCVWPRAVSPWGADLGGANSWPARRPPFGLLVLHPRRRVTAYVREVVRKAIGAVVFTSGSTPLKTYLPDGVRPPQRPTSTLVSPWCRLHRGAINSHKPSIQP